MQKGKETSIALQSCINRLATLLLQSNCATLDVS